VVKYDDGTVLQNYTITTAVFVGLMWVTGHLVKDIHKDVCPVYCCNCHVRAVKTGFRNSHKDVQNWNMMTVLYAKFKL